MNSGSLRLGLLLRLAALLCLLLALDALACYYTALHFANLVYDRWLIDSDRSLATTVHGDNGRVTLDLPRAALEVFQFDAVDTTYYRIDSLRQGFIAGERSLTPVSAVPTGEVRLDFSLIDDHRVRVVTTRLPSLGFDDVTVSVAETVVKRSTLTREIVLVMLAPQVALLAAGLILAWLNVTRGLKPLTDLASAIASRSHDNLTPVALEDLPSEARILADRLNELFGRVSAGIHAQERFVADAAHQLRTPLAALILQAEAAERAGDPDAQRRALRSLRNSADRAARLSQQLLVLMRAGPSAAVAVRLDTMDLTALARRIGEEWVPQMLLRSIDFGLVVPEQPMLIQADGLLLGELLSNLLDNAMRYGSSGGRITLGVLTAPVPQLYVEDEGPGINPDEYAQVFERFYRVPGTNGDGCGLGLSIVQQIAELHGAGVRIQPNVVGKGVRFTVEFGRTRSVTSR